MVPSLKFRNSIRSIAKEEEEGAKNGQVKQKLMKSCDEFRNDLKSENITLKVSCCLPN